MRVIKFHVLSTGDRRLRDPSGAALPKVSIGGQTYEWHGVARARQVWRRNLGGGAALVDHEATRAKAEERAQKRYGRRWLQLIVARAPEVERACRGLERCLTHRTSKCKCSR